MGRSERFQFWRDEYERISHVILGYHKPFHETLPRDIAVDSCLAHLNTALTMISDSIVLLVANERIWEATIVDRTQVEGTTKFLFMCTQDETERCKRVEEFRNELSDVAILRDHRRAEILLQALGNPTGMGFRPVRDAMQPAEELERITKRYSKQERSRLEQKWSFSSMVEAISKCGFPGADSYAAHLFGYSMSSHLIHIDGLAVGAMWERATRTVAHRQVTDLAHGARLISSQIHNALFRVAFARWIKNLSFKDLFMHPDWKPLLDDLDLANKEWHEIEYPSTSPEGRG